MNSPENYERTTGMVLLCLPCGPVLCDFSLSGALYIVLLAVDAALGLLGAILVLHALESPRPLPAVAEPVLQRNLWRQIKRTQPNEREKKEGGNNVMETKNETMEIKNEPIIRGATKEIMKVRTKLSKERLDSWNTAMKTYRISRTS